MVLRERESDRKRAVRCEVRGEKSHASFFSLKLIETGREREREKIVKRQSRGNRRQELAAL